MCLRRLIAQHGAVSEQVARAMAEGVQRRAGATVGIGITGIAGPEWRVSREACGHRVSRGPERDGRHDVRTLRLIGNREQIKYQATQAALNLLRLMLISNVV